MYKIRNRACSGYKSLNDNVLYHRKGIDQNCKDCVYFSSRNCGMDVADSIEPELDIFL